MALINVQSTFTNIPACYNNMYLAIKRIGELDPYKINRTTLRKTHKEKQYWTERNYFQCGVLNLLKVLNGGLKKRGKFSINMINRICKLKRSKGDGVVEVTARFPHNGQKYCQLVRAIYKILWDNDREYCIELLGYTNKSPIVLVNSFTYRIAAPVHTEIIKCAIFNAHFIRSQIGAQIQEHVFRDDQ